MLRLDRFLGGLGVVALPCTVALQSAVGKPADSASAPNLQLALPAESRGDHEVPLSVWDVVQWRLDATDRSIGYGAQDMENYSGDALLPSSILHLLVDARQLPRFSGKVTDELLADAAKPSFLGESDVDGNGR